MATARIITRSRQDVDSLVQQLRARGYTAEIIAPGESGSGTADLEIIADTCAADEALIHATQLAQIAGADVLVAPGIWEAETSPAPEPPAPQTEVAQPAEVVDTRSEDVEYAAPVETSPAFAQPAPEMEVVQYAPAEVTEAPAERADYKPSPAEPLPVPAAQPAMARRNVVSEALVALAGAVGEFGEHVGESVFEAGHRLADQMAAARAVRRQRRGAARERRQRERAERQVAQPQRSVPAFAPIRRLVARPAPAAAPVAARTRPLPPIANPRTPSREREWKLAAIFSAAVAVAIMLAWLAAAHKASSPLPAGMVIRSNSIQQQVPFGPVTLRAPASASVRRLAPSAPKPQAELTTLPAAHAQTSAADDEVIVRHFTRAKPAVRTTQSSTIVKRFSDLE